MRRGGDGVTPRKRSTAAAYLGVMGSATGGGDVSSPPAAPAAAAVAASAASNLGVAGTVAAPTAATAAAAAAAPTARIGQIIELPYFAINPRGGPG